MSADLSWIGWVGGVLSAVQLFPQILKLHRTQSAANLSPLSFAIRFTSYVCYIVHAFNIGDPPLFWMTLTGMLLLCVTIGQMVWYTWRPREAPQPESAVPPAHGRLDKNEGNS